MRKPLPQRLLRSAALLLALGLAHQATAQAEDLLQTVKQRGELIVGDRKSVV